MNPLEILDRLEVLSKAASPITQTVMFAPNLNAHAINCIRKTNEAVLDLIQDHSQHGVTGQDLAEFVDWVKQMRYDKAHHENQS